MKRILFFTVLVALFFAGCTSDTPENPPPQPPKKPHVAGPVFNSDSAFAFVKEQVAFGPRVPGTKPHAACYDYFIAKLKSYGLSLIPQATTGTTAIDSRMVSIQNVLAQFHPERKDRILLLAHWDTRAFADDDPDSTKRKMTFDGADDGASGAGVLLEIARILQQKDPGIGVDLLFSDAEDGGLNGGGAAETWCLGTQYWTQNPPKDYTARFGILLDMVGGKNATFPKEGTGNYFAKGVVDKVWNAAAGLGYSNVFIDQVIGETIDDHLYVNQNLRIPTIDIVHYDMQNFKYPYWHHTTQDNLNIIQPVTLRMVGEVVVDVIYNEM
jgi:hypothetical protein